MDKGTFVNVILEIERYSNLKWEYDRKSDKLYLDRILPYPYFYPYSYGFIPNTLGNDGDELDILYITNEPYSNYNTVHAPLGGYIVGGLVMEDEKGMDEKIFIVPENEIESFNVKSEKEKEQIYENIIWFFSNYKSKEGDRWSKVHFIMDSFYATQLYKDSVNRFMNMH